MDEDERGLAPREDAMTRADELTPLTDSLVR
jgi:hypothetical protein